MHRMSLRLLGRPAFSCRGTNNGLSMFDTHAHLTDPELAEIETEIIEQARAAGIVGIVAIGTDVTSSLQSVQLAERIPEVHASVGIHPNDCHLANDNGWRVILDLARRPEVVGIGETGLDRYWNRCPVEQQREWFARHIQLSHELGKPLIVHMRNCEQDILDALHEHQRDGRIHGIMHSFTGEWETAEQALQLGMYISFAGMVTFKNAEDLRAVAVRVPEDRLLIETDAPYLTPHPHRGQRPNQPCMVRHTAACLAECRKVPLEQLVEATTANARRVFGLEPAPA